MSGQLCTKDCCNGNFSGPYYRIIPLTVEILSILIVIVYVFTEADDGEDGASTEVVENLFLLFWITDYIIQSCVVKGSRADCCGDFCGCGCGAFLASKLIVDGVFLFFVIVDVWASMVLESGEGASLRMLKIMRIFRLLIFVKMGMEIAAIAILCQEKKRPPEPQPTGTVVAVGTVVGQPVVVAGDPAKEQTEMAVAEPVQTQKEA